MKQRMGDLDLHLGTASRTRWRSARELSDADLQAWHELGERALEPNAYACADIVVPALMHLHPKRDVHVLLIESNSRDGRLIGVLPLEAVPGTSDLPLPHLRLYQNMHTFLGGLLVDRDHGALAIRTLFEFLQSNALRWHGLEMPLAWANGPLHDLLRAECAARRSTLFVDLLYQRPVLRVSRIADVLAEKRNRVRDLTRRERRLADRGRVGWHWVRGRAVSSAQIDVFLELEHMGWKGTVGTSMRGDKSQVAYFSDLVRQLAPKNRVFFTELLLDDRPIASTCNFVAADVAHAFKVAWDPAFARFAPGYLSELEIMRNIRHAMPGVAVLESGGNDSAYVADLWIERRPIANCVVATTLLGRNAIRAKALYVATNERMRHGVAQAALSRYEAIPLIDHAIDHLMWML